MDYSMPRPCANCPFLRKGGVRLGEERIREILAGVLGNPGATFACHKTTGVENDKRIEHRHCAGALIFAEKHGTTGQMVRIAERLGMYDPTKLDQSAFELVFDTVDEWLETALFAVRRGRRRLKSKRPRA